jgi:twitching motility protein PilT
MSATLHDLIQLMVSLEASDLHLTSGQEPMLRVDGDIRRIEHAEVIPAETLREMLLEIAPGENRLQFERHNDTDFAYEIPEVGRVRVNLFQDKHGIGGVMRIVPSELLDLEQLGVPDSVRAFCELNKGLVLVTGPTGSGKSTTLASMLHHINQTRDDHIITIEDPIEFLHTSKRCLIHQREMHRDTDSFKHALRASLREDPDIVLVGEMRDLETIETAIETAETGHLVFGTLHTTTAGSTVDRVIDSFPADRQAQVRTMLATSLKGVISQILCKKATKGRIAAYEVLVGTNAISHMIREGKTHQIPSTIMLGAQVGMQTMNDALLKLVEQGYVTPEEAFSRSLDKSEMVNKLAGIGLRMTNAPEDAVQVSGAPSQPQPPLALV